MLDEPFILDKGASTPLYQQVKAKLLAEIRSGRYGPGDPIPTEPKLCEIYDVSRITVRRAISELQDERFLEKRHGKGTFVSLPRMMSSLPDLGGFTENYPTRGYPLKKILLNVNVGNADESLARELSISPGAPIVTIQRLIKVEKTPMTLETSDLPLDLFPKLDERILSSESLYTLLKEEYGREIAFAKRVINVRFADAMEQSYLECRNMEPLFEVEKTVFDSEKVPLQRSLLLSPASRTTLTISNGRQEAGSNALND
jgi:DNA-binding GntR family transcriptional regulator